MIIKLNFLGGTFTWETVVIAKSCGLSSCSYFFSVDVVILVIANVIKPSLNISHRNICTYFLEEVKLCKKQEEDAVSVLAMTAVGL